MRKPEGSGAEAGAGGGFAAYADRVRGVIGKRLERELAEHRDLLAESGSFGSDIGKVSQDFAARGKMLRAILFTLSYQCHAGNDAGGRDEVAGELAGGALELLQCFLLIHDDIMDKSDFRRGAPSVHRYYRERAAQASGSAGEHERGHIGNSLAICHGDVLFALSCSLFGRALDRLAQRDGAGISGEARARIFNYFCSEVTRVGVAQMDDIIFAYNADEPGSSEVLGLYGNKTGHYSIVMPLVLGAEFALCPGNVPEIKKIGYSLGLVFQIRDDIIDLSPSETSGKSAGGDLANGRRTYLRQLFLERAAPGAVKELLELERSAVAAGKSGGGERSAEQAVGRYRALLEASGVLAEVSAAVDTLYGEICTGIHALKVADEAHRGRLIEFAAYCANRTA